MKKWYSVIGDPIAQTMSPFMHTEWFKQANIDATYIPHHVTASKLQQAVQSLKSLGSSGWNVTVPHKSTIIPYLDQLDITAKHMDAVNTVVVSEDEQLIGYNTDGVGFVKALEEKFGIHAKGQNVLIIGAGGAARGISFALEAAGYGPLSIANRTIEKAEFLADELKNATPLTLLKASERLNTFGVIIQTTSVGMQVREDMPIQLNTLAPETIVADIIYNPLETTFLKVAKEKGAYTMNGVGMFVHQGAIAFEKWTGIQPNTEEMIQRITEKLGGIPC